MDMFPVYYITNRRTTLASNAFFRQCIPDQQGNTEDMLEHKI